ncbi:PREDICTED: uncharacterized protein LOC109335132 isoform X1 [Lupinus angustifolius]|uniref:uncharacterized protein LOC109335132 isoform X1 n=1 Tax=Lupinus angustifolius TaxID=3871 RepID=UPI00092F8BC4|nr:PREDICTED: uncharacterized protein LOC109335132 isoform X1 [Lupinus angustifolius]
MLFVDSKEEEKKTMAMGTERSKPLHNFMLPCLKWGSQRHLRCMKVPTDNATDAGDQRPPASRKRGLEQTVVNNARVMTVKPRIHVDDDGGIDAVREKLMLDLKTEAHRMKDAIFGKEVAEENGDGNVAATAAEELVASVGVRPWNLRTRRSACPEKELKIEEKKSNFSTSSPLRTNNNNNNVGGVVMKSPKLKGIEGKMEKVKFSVPLSKKEIEDDFMELLGHRPPRRPKKRTRIVQKQLDTLFPGLWLSEVTADSYKVPEAPETGKR